MFVSLIGNRDTDAASAADESRFSTRLVSRTVVCNVTKKKGRRSFASPVDSLVSSVFVPIAAFAATASGTSYSNERPSDDDVMPLLAHRVDASRVDDAATASRDDVEAHARDARAHPRRRRRAREKSWKITAPTADGGVRRGRLSSTKKPTRANARWRAIEAAGGDDVFDRAGGSSAGRTRRRRRALSLGRTRTRLNSDSDRLITGRIRSGTRGISNSSIERCENRAARGRGRRGGASKRAFDGMVRKWRRVTRDDPPVDENDDEAIVSIPVDPTTRPEGC